MLLVMKAMILVLMVVWVRGAGYEGFGSTDGGEKFPVVKVTSLSDEGPGTFRAAVQRGGRHIVFTNSGKLRLKKTLISNSLT